MADIRWNIYIARIGFVESDSAKLRPVLALNEPIGPHKLVLVAPIFSVKSVHKLVGDIEIGDDYSTLGLMKPSTIRLHRMVALPASIFQEKLGQADSNLQDKIHAELQKLFSL